MPFTNVYSSHLSLRVRLKYMGWHLGRTRHKPNVCVPNKQPRWWARLTLIATFTLSLLLGLSFSHCISLFISMTVSFFAFSTPLTMRQPYTPVSLSLFTLDGIGWSLGILIESCKFKDVYPLLSLPAFLFVSEKCKCLFVVFSSSSVLLSSISFFHFFHLSILSFTVLISLIKYHISVRC